MDVTEGALQAAVDDARVVLVEAERRLAAWRGAATAGQPVEVSWQHGRDWYPSSTVSSPSAA